MIKVLITGGTGFIGSHLTQLLVSKGYRVEHLVRSKKAGTKVKSWSYDARQGTIEDGAFDMSGCSAFHIIHLAGEGIMDKKWSTERKKAIIESRVKTISFLYDECMKRNMFPSSVISAAGIAFYGLITENKIIDENSANSTDFIGDCCVQWEQAAHLFDKICPVTCLRTPLVLDLKKGGFPMMIMPFKFGVKAVVGTGAQWVPWIHISDLCNMYVFAMENRLKGNYNAVANSFITYRELMNELTGKGDPSSIGFTEKPMPKRYFKSFISIRVPVWMVRILYGSRHKLVTEGSKYSNQAIQDKGFVFHFQDIRLALANLFGK